MSNFTIETLKAIADDIDTQRIKLHRIRIQDSDLAGLVAIVSKNQIAFHTKYEVDGIPFQMHIGDAPDLSVEEARKIAIYVIDRGKAGINVQENSRKRLLEELRRDAA